MNKSKTHDYCRTRDWEPTREAFYKADSTNEGFEILSAYLDQVRECERILCKGCNLCTPKLKIETPEPKEDIIETLKKFIPDIDDREPTDSPDNYRDLSKSLWQEFPETIRTFLDSGMLRLNELAPENQQLGAVQHLKSKGRWNNLPLIIKLGIFFGTEDAQSLRDAEEDVRKEQKDRLFKRIEEEHTELLFKKRLRELKERERAEAERILNTPRTEQSFYNDILENKLKEVMKSE